jgi:hypothetical protein
MAGGFSMTHRLYWFQISGQVFSVGRGGNFLRKIFWQKIYFILKPIAD